MKTPLYLDYNATTPVDPRVLERMLPYFTEHFGNASSKGHAYGWAAAEGVKLAREQVAAVMGADPEEVIFTGGATESLNTAIKGVAAAYRKKGRHIVTALTEHSGVLQTCRALERDGFEVTYLGVSRDGLIDLDALAGALSDETILVSIMWANNETGVIHPVARIGEMVRSRGILFLTDATQAFGKIPVDVDSVDMMACTAHKLYGPKGVGALYVRRRNPRVRLVPLIDGGSQEDGVRAGTLNTPGIVGFGAAASIAEAEREREAERLGALRDDMERRLGDAFPDLRVNGAGAARLSHVASITFPGVRSAHLVSELRELAMSTGSACSSGTGKPSHVLKAMGATDEEAYATLRISLGRFTTAADVDFAVRRLTDVVRRLHTSMVGMV